MLLKIILLIVGAVCGENPGWKRNTSYIYAINSHSITSLNGISSGLIFKGKLLVNAKENYSLFGKLIELNYHEVENNLTAPNKMTPLMTNKLFEIQMENGVIKDIIVEKSTQNWEANILKGILSQFQLDTNAENVLNDPINILSKETNSGVFKVMEETVTGRMETLYNIHSLPEDERLFEITKQKNYANVEQHIQYHYGLFGSDEFLIRNSFSRAILEGNLTSFTIKNAYTINELLVKPTLTDMEDAKMECFMNLTLEQVGKGEELQFTSETTPLGGLSYSYNAPYSSNSVVYPKVYTQSKPNLINEPDVPLLPFTVGFNGSSIKHNVNYNIEKEFQQVLESVQKDEENLDKYLLLISLLRAMDFDELEAVCDKYWHNSIFLGGLGQCGTGASFLIIQKLILMRKVSNVQGSILLSQFSSNVREPTEELIQVYYKFVQKNFVQTQLMINNTALLAFTNLVRNVYVDDNIAENRFPMHTFGKFNTVQGKQFVRNELIPYLSDKLHEQLKINDIKKSHVYIRAIGNVGHPKMLQTFEPYLEGRKFATNFQRLWMVLCMDKLINTYPNQAQSVLYRIYRNIGEIEEIRVAAVYLLMKTQPPAEMLNSMAEYTNIDQSEQVNAAVKSSIESAWNLIDDKYPNYRLAAKKAKVSLNKKEYGQQYSTNFVKTFIYGNLYTYLGIETITGDLLDSFQLSIDNNFMKNMFQVDVFNINDFFNQFQQITNSYQGEKFSEVQKTLEGLLNVNIGDMSAMISFENSTLFALPEVIQKIGKGIRPEIDINQWFNPRQITIAFPTETGLSTIYTLETPVNFHLKGIFKGETKPFLSNGDKLFTPSEILGNFDYSFSFKQKIQGKLTILTPFNGNVHSTTYEKNLNLYIPFKTNFQLNLKEKHLKIEIVPKEELLIKSPLFHFSTKSFNSKCNIIGENCRKINKKNEYEKTFDIQQNGMVFKLNVKHEKTSFKDIFSNEIINRQVNFYYDGVKSKNKNIVIKIGEKIAYKTEPTNSHNVLKYLKSFIKNDFKYHNMNIGIYDLSVQFRGNENIEYILKIVCGRSNLDPKSIILIEYLKKSKKLNGLADRFTIHVSNYIPNTNEINFNYSLNNPPIIYSNIQLFYGVKKYLNSIQADVKLERSKERTEFLFNQSLQCKDDDFNRKCRNSIQKVNLFDKINVDINYKNITQEFSQVLRRFYNYYRGFFCWDRKFGKTKVKSDQIAFQLQFTPDLNSFTANLQTKEDSYEINDVFVNDFLKELILVHPVHGFATRLYSKLHKLTNYHPVCSVALNRITTFSNRIYPITFDHRWTILFKYAPNYHQPEHYTILIRKSRDLLHKDVRLILRTPQTKATFQIDLLPQVNGTNLTAQLLINGQFAGNFTDKTYDFNKGYIQIYNLPNNELKTFINKQFYLVSDGINVKLTLMNDKYRKNIRGLCGRFNGNQISDCLTLNNCITLNPIIFTDTYTINSNKTLKCVKSNNLPANVITNNDWIKDNGINQCLYYKSHYIKRDDQICFTIHPILYVKDECQHWKYVNRYHSVFCSNITEQMEFYRNSIDKGNSFDFIQFPVTDNVVIQVPDVHYH